MELNLDTLKNKEFWENKGYKLPKFNIEDVKKNTELAPEWVHFGAGNIFRAFTASICQNLLNKGLISTGIIAVEGYDYDIINDCLKKYDNLTINVTLKSDGTVEKEILASITDLLCMDNQNEKDISSLRKIFRNKSLKLASFTITEKGYNLKDKNGEFFDAVKNDFDNPPSMAETYMGKISALCYERFKANKLPLTLLSMDNCSHNGTKLKNAIMYFAENWAKKEIVENDFIKYLEEDISYPWSMIDKITPRPSEKVSEILLNDNIENIEPIVTSKNTYIAPFVNGEETEYLVIENDFKNGKIPMDKSDKKGVMFTDRETVDKIEKMKVGTCLNPLHTALAIFGCLLSYTKISEEMQNPVLVKLITKMSNEESLPAVVDPKIINPKQFLDEVLKIRFPNNFMPDTPQRIACDTSQKLSVRFGETIKTYLNSNTLNIYDLNLIPLVIAGWIRYLMGYDDNGNKFELSPDPYIETLKPIISKLEFGNNENSTDVVLEITSDKYIFGMDLSTTPLFQKILIFFNELNAGKNAITKTLEKYV